MAFFRSLQRNLPSVSSLVDTISNAVEGLTSAVGEVGCALTDSVAEQVTSMINGFRSEEDCADPSAQEGATLPNCQKAQSDLEHRAHQRDYCNTSVSQRQDQGIIEERVFKHFDDRQQTPSSHQETDDVGDAPGKGRVSDGRTAVTRQDARAGSPCQELGHTDRYKKSGLGISSNGRNDLQGVTYSGMKENHLNKAEKLIKSKGSKGNECSGNECSPKGILVSNRHATPTSMMKEDVHPAPSTNSKDKLHGRIREQINPSKCYKVKGDIKRKKNETISVKKGTAKSKDEKYSKIIPDKGEVS